MKNNNVDNQMKGLLPVLVILVFGAMVMKQEWLVLLITIPLFLAVIVLSVKLVIVIVKKELELKSRK